MSQNMQNSPEQIENQIPGRTRRERVGRQLMMLGMIILLAHFALLLVGIDEMVSTPLGASLVIAGVLVTPQQKHNRADRIALVFAAMTFVMSMATLWLRLSR